MSTAAFCPGCCKTGIGASDQPVIRLFLSGTAARWCSRGCEPAIVGAVQADSGAAGDRGRLRRIEAVTDADLAHLGVEELLAEMLERLCVMLTADTAAVLLLDPSGQFLVATAARGVEEEIQQGVRIPVGEGFAGRIAALREPMILDRVDPATVLNPVLWEKDIRSLLGVPLVVEGTVLGVLHVGTVTTRQFTAEEGKLLQVAADRVALVVRSRQLELERSVATTLQRSLLPATLPSVRGFELASRYVPGGGGGVGGDWYDVFELPFEQLCVVIGDVAGRGIHAAAAMGRIRSTLRAYAMETADPADMLGKLDRNVGYFEPGLQATVLCAVLETGGRVSMSTAGHPPPVLVRRGEKGVLVDLYPDLLLGVDSSWGRRTTTVDLSPGDGLLLYTDGLVEQRGVSLDVGLDRLCRVVRPASPDSVCAAVMRDMVGDGQVRDDIAMLMLYRTPAGDDDASTDVRAG